MDREALAEQFKLDVTPVSNDRCREVKPKCSSRQHERGVVIWTRKEHLAHNVYVEKSTSGELRVVKQVAMAKRTSKSELAVIGMITKATETQNKKLFVEFKGWFSDQDHIYLVMEYCRFGHILYCFRNPLPESEARSICQQLLEAVEVLHGLGIVHRDIKPQNVLVAQKTPIRVKLADFGISRLIEDTQLKTGVGTFGYSAPEVWGALEETNESSAYSYTAAVDIFSLGCLVYSVLTGQSPFPGNSFKSVADYATGRTGFPETPLLEKGVSLSGRSFILRLLSVSPKKRPKATADLIDDWIVPRKIEKPLAQICVPVPKQVSEPTTFAESDDPEVKSSFPVEGVDAGITASDGTTTGSQKYSQTAIDFMSLQLWNLFKQAETPEDGNEQVRIYLENGADPNILHLGYSALHLAVMPQERRMKPLSWLKTLLVYGANPNFSDKFGQYPLHSVISNYAELSLNRLDLLLQYRADPKLKDKQGQSSIHIIVATINKLAYSHNSPRAQYKEMVKLKPMKDLMSKFDKLTAAGAQLEAHDEKGLTPLLYASRLGNVSSVYLLVDKGANIHARCGRGLTPLHYLVTAGRGSCEPVKFLLRQGSNPNDMDNDGRTSLHHAASLDWNWTTIDFLLQNGANVNERDHNGMTALDIAASTKNYNYSTIRRLVETGGECKMRDGSVRRRVKRARLWANIKRTLAFKPNLNAQQVI